MSLRSKVSKHLRRIEKPFETLNEITVSKSAILHNFDFFASLAPKGYVIPVLKSNAYGHGIEEVATILKDRDIPYIAVDGYYEGLAVHAVSKNQRVLVMGAIHPNNYKDLHYRNFAFVVHDNETIEALGKTGRNVAVHIELDTGMTRHGVSLKELPEFLTLLAQYKNLVVEGVMTHLADADNAQDNTYTQIQTEAFDKAVALIKDSGFQPHFIHIAQSAGSTKVTSKYANTLRVGIALYGVTPLSEADNSDQKMQSLLPALSLYSRVTKINNVESGTSVSYSRTFTTSGASRIGTLPLGYYEGIPRELSNEGVVKYDDSYLPIVGRVCMNHTMINLGNSNIKVGDKVTVISADKANSNSVDAICKKHGLFNYSFLIHINQNIRRKIVT